MPCCGANTPHPLRTQIKANKRRLEVAVIVNLRSDAGHDALCWAVANHEYRSAQILLNNGATANYDDNTLWQSARLIQQCWKRFKWATGTERLRHKSIIDRWLHDTAHMKELKRVVFERRAVRRGSRVAICEAVFNSCDDVRMRCVCVCVCVAVCVLGGGVLDFRFANPRHLVCGTQPHTGVSPHGLQ